MMTPNICTPLSDEATEGGGALAAPVQSGKKNRLEGLQKLFAQTKNHVIDKGQACILSGSRTLRRILVKQLIDGIENEQVIAAFWAAMKAPYPHKCSPALPLQVAYDYTKLKNESDLEWLHRFLKMDGEEFSWEIGWELDENCWSQFVDVPVSGREIMMECVGWHEIGWDFSRFPDDYFTRHEEDLIESLDPHALKRMESNLIPMPREIIRRSWRQSLGGKELLFNFDIWRRNSDWFCWRLRLMSEKPVVVTKGIDKFWKLEGFIAPMLVPEHATRSFVSVAECGYDIHDDKDGTEDGAEDDAEEGEGE